MASYGFNAKTRQYRVEIDPYDGGTRAVWTVSAPNAREAKRRARRLAEREGWMAAAWRGVTVHDACEATNLDGG